MAARASKANQEISNLKAPKNIQSNCLAFDFFLFLWLSASL